MRLHMLVLALSLAIVHPATAQAVPFDQLRQTWKAALESHNLEASLALYTPDANFINADGTHAVSPEDIRKLYIKVFTAFNAKIELTSRATGQSGDLAFDSGSYSEDITMRIPASASDSPQRIMHYTGDYVTLYRRDDGRWRIVQQVWTATPDTAQPRL